MVRHPQHVDRPSCRFDDRVGAASVTPEGEWQVSHPRAENKIPRETPRTRNRLTAGRIDAALEGLLRHSHRLACGSECLTAVDGLAGDERERSGHGGELQFSTGRGETSTNPTTIDDGRLGLLGPTEDFLPNFHTPSACGKRM